MTALRSEALGLVEAQRRSGRIDQEVVRDLRARAVGGLRGDVRSRVVAVAVRVDLPRGSLHELDPRPFVDRRQRERDLCRLHQPNPDPDVGRHPVVIRPGGDHSDGVVATEPAARERRRGMSGDAGSEHDNPAHNDRRPSHNTGCAAIRPRSTIPATRSISIVRNASPAGGSSIRENYGSARWDFALSRRHLLGRSAGQNAPLHRRAVHLDCDEM